MLVLGIDLGGTKLALALFDGEGNILKKESVALEGRSGAEVGKLITEQVSRFNNYVSLKRDKIGATGISVPGIFHTGSGKVWAPNIPGWEDYPLMDEMKTAFPGVNVTIDSDRACCMLGESWKGSAKDCQNAIFLAVGTGIGAGIMVNGEILRGSNDIAGAIGWMALNRPYEDKYINCGYFEYYASGEGIARVAREILEKEIDYTGELRNKNPEEISSYDVFTAYQYQDPVAVQVIVLCVEYWGMAVANLVSLFNPGKIILGGGVFGPAIQLIPAIREEALKWAQPLSINQVTIEESGLGGEAAVYGAAYLALKSILQDR
jgi:glucokinase